MALTLMSSQPLSSALHRSLYEDSTQHQHWHFSRGGLEEKRVSLNAAAVQAIRSTFEAEDVILPSTDPEFSLTVRKARHLGEYRISYS